LARGVLSDRQAAWVLRKGQLRWSRSRCWPGWCCLALLVDVFGTVFVPRGGAGFVTSRLYRFVWAGWMRAAARAGRHRRSILALAGPVLLPLTVAVWVAELVGAFALVYRPFVEQFSVPQSGAGPSWVTSLYVSAYSATTLGVGDVYASTSWLRLLMTLEAGLGFALFSISITYVLSVYGALLRATALALQSGAAASTRRCSRW
jgi:hypothetical protein